MVATVLSYVENLNNSNISKASPRVNGDVPHEQAAQIYSSFTGI
jgi:hypothetical protein